MKILFLSDNFPPEGNAPASRTYEHCIRWVRAGDSVTVITGAPNFPEGTLFHGYRNRWYCVEDMDGIRVVRVKTYITANEGFLRRTLDYLSFMVTSFLAGLFQSRPDLIVGTSPQFFTVCSAWMLSVFRRRPFVFELRDLWPDSIRAVGAMQESRAIRALRRLEMFLYNRADLIVPVTDAFKQELAGRGVEPGKMKVVINGVDLAQYTPRAKDETVLEEFGLAGKFVVGYIGTHGMAHALERVLETAEILRSHDDVRFMLVGSGARRESLISLARERSLDNVIFVPRQPKDRMPSMWSVCDASLVQLKNDPLFAKVIPSKIFESMGMGLPIIVSLPAGEATRLVEAAGAGVTVPPEDPAALADAVLELKRDSVQRERLSRAAVAAACIYSRDSQAERMRGFLYGAAGIMPEGSTVLTTPKDAHNQGSHR